MAETQAVVDALNATLKTDFSLVGEPRDSLTQVTERAGLCWCTVAVGEHVTALYHALCLEPGHCAEDFWMKLWFHYLLTGSASASTRLLH